MCQANFGPQAEDIKAVLRLEGDAFSESEGRTFEATESWGLSVEGSSELS